MFMHHLNERQARGLFALAARMIAADRVVNGDEIDYLNALIVESGLAGDEPLRDKGKPVDLEMYKDRRSQMAVAMELLILANTDDDYDVSELVLWGDIIDRFDFNEREREHLRANAEVAAMLIRNIDELIETPLDDTPMTERERRRERDRRKHNRRGFI